MVGTGVTTVVVAARRLRGDRLGRPDRALFAFRVVPYLLFGVIAGPLADPATAAYSSSVAMSVTGCSSPRPHRSVFGVLTVAQVYVVGLLSATASSSPMPLSSAPFRRSSVPSGCRPPTASSRPRLRGRDRRTRARRRARRPRSALPAPSGRCGHFLVAAAAAVHHPFSFSDRSVAGGRGHACVPGAGARSVHPLDSTRSPPYIGVSFGNSFAFGAVLGLLVRAPSQSSVSPTRTVASGCCTAPPGRRAARRSPVRALVPHRAGALAHSRHALRVRALAAGLAIASLWWRGHPLVAFSWSIATTINVGITSRQLAAPDDLRSASTSSDG